MSPPKKRPGKAAARRKRGAGRPRGDTGATTRELILDAAEQLYAEHGFAGTAVRDIARRVGVNPASLYAHYRGKDSMYAEVLTRGLKPFFEINQALVRSEWTEDALARGMDALMDHLSRRPQVLRLVLHEALAGGAHLSKLASEWLGPGYALALRAFRAGGRPLLRKEWDEADLPDLVASLFFLILGHIAIAPLLADMFVDDASAARDTARRIRFLRKAVRVFLFESAPPTKAAKGKRARRR